MVSEDTNLRVAKTTCGGGAPYERARNFTFVREPVERLVSAFHYLAEHAGGGVPSGARRGSFRRPRTCATSCRPEASTGT